MNNYKISILRISIIILSFIGIKKLIYINQANDLKNKEESILNESIRVLNECFDLENKNEYCIDEYGYKNWFQNVIDEFLRFATNMLINKIVFN